MARERERERRAAQLETSLAEARLHALSLQIQPHFLFNTLNGIASLVRVGQNAQAIGMIGGLSDLLRYALDRAAGAPVAPPQERAMLPRPLEIPRPRFPGPLAVEIAMSAAAPPAREARRPLLAAVRGATRGGGGRGGAGAARRGGPRPDVLFLDVHMPEVDGFDLLEQIGAERAPTVVFVTAYADHALRAFEVHAIDYLLKPIVDARFAQALARAKPLAQLRRAGDPAGPGRGALLRQRSRATQA